MVTGWDPSRPCSPEVRPLLGSDGDSDRHLLGAPIDLSRQPALSITKADSVRVAEHNFHPLQHGEFDLRLSPGSLLSLDTAEAA